MSNGYPINFRPAGSAGGGARAVAIAVGRPQLSLGAVARSLSSIPRIPPPHPGIILAVGAAVAIGYAYQYFNEEEEVQEDIPYPAVPPVITLPGEKLPFDTNEWEDRGDRWLVPGFVARPTSSNYNKQYIYSHKYAVGYIHKYLNTFQRWFGTWEQGSNNGWWHRTRLFPPYSSSLPQDLPASVGIGAGRNSPVPGTGGSLIGFGYLNPPSTPDVEILPVTPPVTRPYVPGIRGVSVTPSTTGSVSTPMTPVPNEVKAQVSAQTMNLISATIGQVGETIDMTKCIMWATGNTYTGRDGTEKTIPQRQWKNALLYMAGQWHNKEIRLHGSQSMNNLTYSKMRNGSIVKADGTILTASEMGTRLAECIVKTYLSDLAAAKQSQFISAVGGEMNLTAGPLGIQSWVNALNGQLAYDGVFDLNL